MNESKVRIFISSPSDLEHERALVGEIIESLSQEYLPYFEIEAVLWEQEALTAAQSFQAGLVRPSQCEIVLVMLWTRLGTPLADEPYGGMTGTEWEFVDAVEASVRPGGPEVLVYRKSAPRMVDITNAEATTVAVTDRDRLEIFFRRHFFNEDGSFRRAFRQFDDDARFRDLVETQLRKLLNRRIGAERRFAAGPSDWHGSPFRPEQPFDVADARVFIGREAETRELIARLDALREAAPRLLLVTGASGVGKSSLVRAGLVPHLIRPFLFAGLAMCRWCVVEFAAGDEDPIATLASALCAPGMLGGALDALGVDAPRLSDLIASEPRFAADQILAAAGHAERELRRGDANGALQLAIIIDPLDPLLEEAIPGAQAERIAELLALLVRRPGIWVIATLRSDRLARLPRLPALTGLLDEERWYRLGPTAPARIRQIVEIPARVAGIEYEERPGGAGVGVVETLESDAGTSPHWPPLLQRTLEDLYTRVMDRAGDQGGNGDRRLGVEDYRSIGGVTGSMLRLADSRWSALDAAARDGLTALCRGLIALDDGARARPVPRDGDLLTLTRLPGCAALLDALIEARLVVVESLAEPHLDRRCAPPSPSLTAHFKGVLTQIQEEWRARLRLGAKQASLETLTEVPDAAQAEPVNRQTDWSAYRSIARFAHPALPQRWQPMRDWLAEPNHRRGLILRTQIARQAQQWKRTDCNQEYLLGESGYAAAQDWADTHRDELEPLEQEFLQHSWARLQFQRRRNRVTIGATLALLMVFAGVALYALWDARHEARISHQQGLLRQADIAIDRGDPLKAVRLAWEAGRDLPEEATERLARAIASNHLIATIPPDAAGSKDWAAPAVADNGETLVTYSPSAGSRRWRLDGGRYRPVETLSVPGDSLRAVALVGDGPTRQVLGIGGSGVWALPAEPGQPPDWPCGVQGRLDATPSPGGRLLAVPHRGEGDEDALCLLDLTRPGEVLWDRDLPGEPIRAIAFSPDGDLIALASRAGRVLLLDPMTGEQVGVLPQQGAFDKPAYRVAFGPAGKRIAVATWDEQVHVFERDGKPLMVLGSVLRGDRQVRIHQSTVRAMAFSPDGRLLLVGDGTGQLVRWDLDTRSPEVLGEHDLAIERIDIAPGVDPRLGEHLALSLSQDGSARLWGLETGAALTDFSHDAPISDARFSADGRRVITASNRGGSVRLWSVAPENGLTLHLANVDHARGLAVAELPPGKGRAGDLLLAVAGHDGGIDLWRHEPGPERKPPTREMRLTGHEDRLRQVVFAPSMRWLASAGADGTARVWDLASGESCRLDVTAEPGVCVAPGASDCPSVYQVRFSPDERWLVTASNDSVQPLRLWDPLTCRALAQPPSFASIEGGVRALGLASSKSGALLLAAGGRDGSLEVLRQDATGTWSLLCGIDAHDGWVRALDFSPDGRWLATAGRDGRAALIDLADDRCAEPRYLNPDAGMLYDVRFAPDGRDLVTAAFDAKAHLWSLDGTLVAELIGHQNRVDSARFSPDGQWIMTTSRDGAIAIWRRPRRGHDLAPKPYLMLDPDLQRVTDATFDPGGTMIAAAYWDKAAVLWRLWNPEPDPPEALVAHWGTERARLALIGEAQRYLHELDGGSAVGASADHPSADDASGGDR